MKNLLTIFICCSVLIVSCNNFSGKNAEVASATTPPSNNGNETKGEAFVSYTIDGKDVMIKDSKLFINKVINNTPNGTVNIEVTNFSANPAEVLHIIAHNNGTTTISHSAGGGSPFSDKPFAELMIQNSNHYADAATVNITQITGNYAEGTFSGKFTGDKGIQDQTQETVNITNGKFHLPFKSE
jgi:hypothetical protein